MTKSELIERITEKHPEMSSKDIELAVKTILDTMSQALSQGDRIEIRGFGSFSLHFRNPRIGRNPKTGKLYLCVVNMCHILSRVKNFANRLTSTPQLNISRALTLTNMW